MSELIKYAYRIDSDRETPCHLSEIKKGDVFYLMVGASRSELHRATDDAFIAHVNDNETWSIPHELYE